MAELQMSDHWRPSCVGYATQWGFTNGSGIARLIDFVREEYRAGYACDYRLRKIGKNKFLAVSGKDGDYGVAYVVRHAKRFHTTVVTEIDVKTMHVVWYGYPNKAHKVVAVVPDTVNAEQIFQNDRYLVETVQVLETEEACKALDNSFRRQEALDKLNPVDRAALGI